MTKWEAIEDLKGIMDGWLNFECWAYLQLEIRGEWSNERMHEVLQNHKRAKRRKIEYQNETRKGMREMREIGASTEEINAYSRSRAPGLQKLVSAWRSLDGLPE